MNNFNNLAEMMLIPGNRDVWENYLKDNFVTKNENENNEKIIEYLSMERDLVNQEHVWSVEQKVNRLATTIKSKLTLKP